MLHSSCDFAWHLAEKSSSTVLHCIVLYCVILYCIQTYFIAPCISCYGAVCRILLHSTVLCNTVQYLRYCKYVLIITNSGLSSAYPTTLFRRVCTTELITSCGMTFPSIVKSTNLRVHRSNFIELQIT